ncbi:MAG TPA: DapH/DapD/GlmU-related protein, partial [Rhodothermales bacterium]|nr:DapH/DapD/GlmU-related protein [Rhodothermales bacterium]
FFKHRTEIGAGAFIGSNSALVAPVRIGDGAIIGAGSVVTRDVADYALVVGNPARRMGWMSRHGLRLQFGADGTAVCPRSGLRYQLEEGAVRCLDLDEDAPLPVAP